MQGLGASQVLEGPRRQGEPQMRAVLRMRVEFLALAELQRLAGLRLPGRPFGEPPLGPAYGSGA